MKLNVMGPRPAVDSIPLRWTTAVLALLFAPIVLAQSRGTIIPDEVPVGAYVRTLGDVSPAQSLVLPTAITPPPGLPGHDKTTAVASGGISLGGIGAGSFEINQFGTFGPWNFDGQHEQRILTQAALHIREQLKGQAASVRTLAMNGNIGDALPAAWPLLNKGDAVYSALYPFGWINYKPFATRVITRFWSPIVSNSDELSSMPVAYFDVQVTNPKKVDATVSVMFTFPNAAAHVAGTSAANWMTGKPIAMTGSSRTSR
jgi:non-lysosomal glucosylceramidase